MLQYSIRPMRESEIVLLQDFLYEAIFVPEGDTPPTREIIHNANLQVYLEGFGKNPDDRCFVAEVQDNVVGAVWVRIMDDYGHVDDDTPSFAISLHPNFRGCGIGTSLMRTMLEELKRCGYRQASLAVQKTNYAVSMYKKVGFDVFDENECEYIMVCKLNP